MCRKVILSVNVTADGFMAGHDGALDWHFEHWNSEMADYAWHQLNTVDTILVGRVAYEAMSAHWPQAVNTMNAGSRELAFAKRMNDLPKLVFSTTLKEAGWKNSRIITNHLKEEILHLKQQPGKDMILWGGVSIVSAFIELGLIDEYRLFITPVILGKGKPLYTSGNGSHGIPLTLLSVQTFGNGVVLMSYQKKHT